MTTPPPPRRCPHPRRRRPAVAPADAGRRLRLRACHCRRRRRRRPPPPPPPPPSAAAAATAAAAAARSSLVVTAAAALPPTAPPPTRLLLRAPRRTARPQEHLYKTTTGPAPQEQARARRRLRLEGARPPRRARLCAVGDGRGAARAHARRDAGRAPRGVDARDLTWSEISRVRSVLAEVARRAPRVPGRRRRKCRRRRRHRLQTHTLDPLRAGPARAGGAARVLRADPRRFGRWQQHRDPHRRRRQRGLPARAAAQAVLGEREGCR